MQINSTIIVGYKICHIFISYLKNKYKYYSKLYAFKKIYFILFPFLFTVNLPMLKKKNSTYYSY